MTQAIQKKLNDSAFARWTALILVALTMFFGYMFVDVLSPLQNMLESTRGWSPTIFGLYGGSEFILNVCGFLLVAGIILDKDGRTVYGYSFGLADGTRCRYQILRTEQLLL